MANRRRPQGATVVLNDVARRAGVSTASVSRVLNNPAKVSPALRTRVEAAIAELGYIPHGAARALASRRTRTIGAIVPTLDNAIFAACIGALQHRLKRAGYTLLVASSDYDPDEEWREVQVLLERGVEGIMLVGAQHHPGLYCRLRSQGVPYVNGWIHDPGTEHPCIGFDNHDAAARATRHLLSLGHRRIAMVAGRTEHNDRAAARVQGVRAALAAAGLELSPDRLIEQRYGIREGREALRQLLGQAPRPTAIVGGNDVLAFGVLLEALARELAVPGQLSVTGFDDLPLASHLQPPLTTLHVPSARIGELAGDYLLARIQGETPPIHQALPVELVVRATTGPPGP